MDGHFLGCRKCAKTTKQRPTTFGREFKKGSVRQTDADKKCQLGIVPENCLAKIYSAK